MNRECVLEMSRKENKNKDLVGKNAEISVSAMAGISMAVLSLIFYATQIAIQGNCNWGLFAIITFYNAVLNVIKGIKISKKSNIVAGIMWAILTVVLSVAHINNLITTSAIL